MHNAPHPLRVWGESTFFSLLTDDN
uniref:Uncharacterized protein n=1 Tax=Tetranychus urticae TaxID=32264 RepID=T1L6H1_TETUR